MLHRVSAGAISVSVDAGDSSFGLGTDPEQTND